MRMQTGSAPKTICPPPSVGWGDIISLYKSNHNDSITWRGIGGGGGDCKKVQVGNWTVMVIDKFMLFNCVTETLPYTIVKIKGCLFLLDYHILLLFTMLR